MQAIVNADQLDEIVIGVFAKNGSELIAVGRLNIFGKRAETAMVVADDWHGQGVASLLKEIMIDVGKSACSTKLGEYNSDHESPSNRISKKYGLSFLVAGRWGSLRHARFILYEFGRVAKMLPQIAEVFFKVS